MARIFLALTPEKDLNNQIVEVKKQLKSSIFKETNISWQKNDHHHLTIYFVGEMEPEQMAEMNKELSLINFTNISNSIELTEVTFFPNENSQVLVATVKQNMHLLKLYEKVEEIVVNIGFGSDLKQYRPHITLGRLKEKNKFQYEFEALDEAIKGKVKDLSVFETEFNEGKTKYTLLKSFELENRS